MPAEDLVEEMRTVRLLTIAQVAERLSCTKRQVQYLAKEGELPYLKIGLGEKRQGGLRIPADAVDAFITDRLAQAEAARE